MICPKCSGSTVVVDSVRDDESVYRRRKCLDCGSVFFSIEVIQNASATLFNIYKRQAGAESKRRRSSKKV